MKHFTTAGLRQSEAVPFWFDYVCTNYIALDIVDLDDEAFRATSNCFDIGQTRLSRVCATGGQYVR